MEKRDEPLARYTTLGIGGCAKLLLLPENLDELSRQIQQQPNSFLLGGGANLLISDRGLEVVICTKKLRMIEVKPLDDGATITVDCGFGLTALSTEAKRQRLTGLEFAYGIPGSVGGAVVMNAGACGGEIKDVLTEVELLVGEDRKWVLASELKLSYRSSSLPDGAVILRAKLQLKKGKKLEIAEKMESIKKARAASQPLEYKSAGSIYKNPEGDYAGRVIEQLGFKGQRQGGAEVSTKHANWIINRGLATAGDVTELMKRIEEKSLATLGIKLEREIRLAGDF